ncbi:MAG: response regulator [Candidatus Margulisiibacteriota bacterium]|nr:response regulator [Candidatus Margulisiibacteriota bacterium]
MAKTVLIIEDYPETLIMLTEIVKGAGYAVKTSETGEEALKIIGRSPMDAVLLDIMLPRIDGFEVCRRIKGDPKTKNIPVIAVTAFDVPDIEAKCLQAGADEVVMKPFEIEDLLNKLKKYIKNG